MSETSEVEPAGGLLWGVSESEDEQRPGEVSEEDVRAGRIPDPNLGDVPVDEQPHPGSDPDDLGENTEGAL